jgi:hypothetical protein
MNKKKVLYSVFIHPRALASRQIKQEHRKHKLFLLKTSLTEESGNTCVGVLYEAVNHVWLDSL